MVQRVVKFSYPEEGERYPGRALPFKAKLGHVPLTRFHGSINHDDLHLSAFI